MVTGPGKYDDVCSKVAELVGITDIVGGGVIVIVLGGNKGSGFSVQADLATTQALPMLLRKVADQIDESEGL